MSRQKARSSQELYAEANKIKSTLKKLSGKKLFKARKRISMLEFTARSRTKSTTEDVNQGLLPGFTSEVNATTAEMARDFIWQALRKQIQVEMKEIQKHLKLA